MTCIARSQLEITEKCLRGRRFWKWFVSLQD